MRQDDVPSAIDLLLSCRVRTDSRSPEVPHNCRCDKAAYAAHVPSSLPSIGCATFQVCKQFEVLKSRRFLGGASIVSTRAALLQGFSNEPQTSNSSSGGSSSDSGASGGGGSTNHGGSSQVQEGLVTLDYLRSAGTGSSLMVGSILPCWLSMRMRPAAYRGFVVCHERAPNPAGNAPAQATTPASGSGKKEKFDADCTYEDGSLLFTAETLAKVSFEDLKP